jgi:hypothetical protein
LFPKCKQKRQKKDKKMVKKDKKMVKNDKKFGIKYQIY